MHKDIKKIFHEEQVLAEAAARYGFSKDQVRFLADAENYVYECMKDNQPYILKITHTIRRSSDYIMGEMEWLRHLAIGENFNSQTAPVAERKRRRSSAGRKRRVIFIESV